jgi:hypothetical protein
MVIPIMAKKAIYPQMGNSIAMSSLKPKILPLKAITTKIGIRVLVLMFMTLLIRTVTPKRQDNALPNIPQNKRMA